MIKKKRAVFISFKDSLHDLRAQNPLVLARLVVKISPRCWGSLQLSLGLQVYKDFLVSHTILLMFNARCAETIIDSFVSGSKGKTETKS